MSLPDNCPAGYEEEVDWYCNNCSETFEVICWSEFGMTDPVNEDDTICPECGSHNTE